MIVHIPIFITIIFQIFLFIPTAGQSYGNLLNFFDEQKQNVTITLLERRLNDYENLE